MIVPIKIAKDLVEIVDLQGLHNHATLNFLWHLVDFFCKNPKVFE